MNDERRPEGRRPTATQSVATVSGVARVRLIDGNTVEAAEIEFVGSWLRAVVLRHRPVEDDDVVRLIPVRPVVKWWPAERVIDVVEFETAA
jgi:hypothetical protein